MTELKPCPFCGDDEPRIVYQDYDGEPIHTLTDVPPERVKWMEDKIMKCSVVCMCCGGTMRVYSPSILVEEWNRRVYE